MGGGMGMGGMGGGMGGGMQPGMNPQMMMGNFSNLLQEAYNQGVNNGYEQTTGQAQDTAGKKNLVFRTGAGITRNVQVDNNSTVGDALKLFLRVVGQAELINDTEGKIVFLFNAQNLDVQSEETVESVFRGVTPTIVVNDTANLIGA